MAIATDYNAALDNFYNYLEGIIQLYQNSIPVLKKELESIGRDDIDALNESLKQQQAILLKTRSFDINLAGHLSNLGISAGTLREAIPMLPKEKQLSFYGLLGQFEQTAKEVNFYKEKCNVMLHMKLNHIDLTMSKQHSSKGSTIYNQNAVEIPKTRLSKAFETKI